MKTLLFVNKKKQKNFIHWRSAHPGENGAVATSKRKKFFCFFLFTKRSLLLACLLLPLTACGRKGPPNPPGPADQITFPRAYPAR